MFNFVEQKNKAGIIETIKANAIAIALLMLCFSLQKLFISFAGFRWREFLTE